MLTIIIVIIVIIVIIIIITATVIIIVTGLHMRITHLHFSHAVIFLFCDLCFCQCYFVIKENLIALVLTPKINELELIYSLLILVILLVGIANPFGDSTLVTRLSNTMSRSPSPAPTPATVSSVVLKIPPFWPADPELWFAQVEAQFATRGITVQKTKFEHVVASLSPEYAMEVRDLILKPPSTSPYDSLKDLLIKRTTASEQRRLQQLFNAEDLGDRTPSQLLRRMQQLLGDKASTAEPSFLRELFLQRLPPQVRMVLASTRDTEDLEVLASLADRVVEVATPSVSSVETSQLSAEVDKLRTDITDLKSLVKSLTSLSASHYNPTHRKHFPKRRTPSPAPPNRSTGLCWYHSRFASKATKCTQPCSWESENSQAGH